MDPWINDLDFNNNNSDFCTEQEGNDGHLDWPDIKGEGWYTEDAALTHPNHTDPLMGNVKHNSYNKWEAFHTELWGMEDIGNPNWAGLDHQQVKKGGGGLSLNSYHHHVQYSHG